MGLGLLRGAEMTVPANSAPATQGKAFSNSQRAILIEGCVYLRCKSLTRLVLVFALDLENVKEVGGGGVDLDEIGVVFGGGIGEV